MPDPAATRTDPRGRVSDASRAAVVDGFRRLYGSPPELVVRAPGRVNLVGAHIDHLQGWVLPGAIDRAVWLAASPCPEPSLRLAALDLGARSESRLDRLPAAGRPFHSVEWWSYPLALAAALRDSGLAPAGMQVVYGGNLPRDAGVSSSAAVEMAFALAWNRLGGWELRPTELAELGRRAENDYLGVESGIMDQLACLCGRPGQVLLVDCETLRCDPIPLPEGEVVIVADSGTRRRLSGSGFNDRRAEALAALELLRCRGSGIGGFRDLDPAQFEELAAALPPLPARRARHVVTEFHRVQQAAEALRRADLAQLAELMRASHESSRDNYEVSIPELDTLAEAAWDSPRCHGARLSGGGFGGCVTALAHADDAEDVADRMSTALEHRFGRRAETFTHPPCRGGGGRMTRPVEKAVIPAAGRGTRMRPATLAVPKELLALADRPAIQFVLEEALAAGIVEVAIVTRPEKALIRHYVERIMASEPRFAGLRPTWIEQRNPTGLGDALLACREFAGDDSFALLLPDNVLLHPDYRLASLLELAGDFDRDVVGVIAVDSQRSGEYGNSGRIDWEPLRPGAVRINRLCEKRPGRLVVGPGETLLRTCGRYVCRPHLFDHLERQRPFGATDYDEVPAYRAIANLGGLLGCEVPQPLFDVGHPSGFLAACAWLHQQRLAETTG